MKEKLTPREYAILSTLVETGWGNATAAAMGLKEQTVKNHLTSIRKKAGASSSIQLAYLLGAGQLDWLIPEETDATDYGV